MKTLWRMVKWLAVGLAMLIAGLLSPVVYSEAMCRPSGEAEVTQAILDPATHRLESRTLMTYPEWHIVHAYDDYAQVIAKDDPHSYGYLSGIAGFWNSLCALSKATGQLGTVDTETKQMVYVIGVSFTAELLAKAAYEETVGRLFTTLRGSKRSALDDVSADQARAYASFLQQVPWYKWDFDGDAQSLKNAGAQTLRDRERRLALGLEYGMKSAYAEVIAAAVAGVGADELTLRMIVDGVSSDTLERFDGITVIGQSDAGIEIETIRYRALTHLMAELATAGVNYVEIAGNDDIMLTLISGTATHPAAIYSAQRQGFGDYRHLVLTKVGELSALLRDLNDGGAKLEHIHDY